jgi:hypothetical protein
LRVPSWRSPPQAGNLARPCPAVDEAAQDRRVASVDKAVAALAGRQQCLQRPLVEVRHGRLGHLRRKHVAHRVAPDLALLQEPAEAGAATAVAAVCLGGLAAPRWRG